MCNTPDLTPPGAGFNRHTCSNAEHNCTVPLKSCRSHAGIKMHKTPILENQSNDHTVAECPKMKLQSINCNLVTAHPICKQGTTNSSRAIKIWP